MLPPSSALLNALARLDPFPRIDGPEARVPRADGGDRARPRRPASGRGASVVKILGNACGLGVEGSGWVAGDGLVVTNAHVVAGQDDTRVLLRGREPGLDAQRGRLRPAQRPRGAARATGSTRRALPLAANPRSGTSAAILGFPRNGPVRRARRPRSGETREVDHPGRLRAAGRCGGSITSLRGAVRSGQLRRADGRRRTAGRDDDLRRHDQRARAAASACPNAIVRAAAATGRASDGVSTGPVRRLRRYPPRPMGKTLVIAEKPSVGRDLTRALPGAFTKHEGYLESDTHVVTWAVGHLVQLAEPDEYDAKYKKWRMADLPIVPDRFKLVVRDERSRKQMTVITQLLKRDDVDEVINACDAGREGELIFAWTFEKAGAKKPVQRLWLSSMTSKAIKQAFGGAAPGVGVRACSSRPRGRARRRTGSSA